MLIDDNGVEIKLGDSDSEQKSESECDATDDSESSSKYFRINNNKN